MSPRGKWSQAQWLMPVISTVRKLRGGGRLPWVWGWTGVHGETMPGKRGKKEKNERGRREWGARCEEGTEGKGGRKTCLHVYIGMAPSKKKWQSKNKIFKNLSFLHKIKNNTGKIIRIKCFKTIETKFSANLVVFCLCLCIYMFMSVQVCVHMWACMCIHVHACILV